MENEPADKTSTHTATQIILPGRITILFSYISRDACGLTISLKSGHYDVVTQRNSPKAESIVALSIKLEAATHRKGHVWLAWCFPIDVITQADTKQAALRSLKEAVELWFESCIARNVLEEDLLEAGFHKTKIGAMIPKNTSAVRAPAPKPPAHALTAKRDFIEVSIPAYIAAHGNADNLRAPR